MPFVRVSRDKRGYEHTYLIQPPRVLYWFRTPPGVRVGRAPFDRDTQRAIEAQNPGVVFDWPRIISTAVPPPLDKDVEHWRERRRADRAAKRARAAEAAEGLPAAAETTEPEDRADLESDPEIEEVVEEAEEKENVRLDTDMASAAEATASSPAPSEPPEHAPAAKRRRRRRGRRRRRRENGPLDQAKPPVDSSNQS